MSRTMSRMSCTLLDSAITPADSGDDSGNILPKDNYWLTYEVTPSGQGDETEGSQDDLIRGRGARVASKASHRTLKRMSGKPRVDPETR